MRQDYIPTPCPMATLYRRPNSSVWWTAFFDSDGKRQYRSTGKKSRSEATAAAADLEQRARRITPQDDERRRSILRILEEAGEMALRGTLNQGTAQILLNRMTEAATGESLQHATIEEWFRGWVTEKRGSKSKSTGERYGGLIEAFLKFLPKSKLGLPLAALSVADVRGFRDHIATGGRAVATVNLAVKTLRGPLNLARRQGLIQNNPAEAVEMLQSDGGEKDVFSPEDVAKLIRAADENWQGLILGGYYTGARLGDLLALTWKNLDLARMTIAFGQKKTKGFVEIPIHPDLHKWLERAKDKSATALVFPISSSKKSGGAHGMSERFKALMKKAGIEGVVREKAGEKGRNRSSLTFHSLRHSFNSAMANAGVSQELRQRLTGHASKAINDRYTHTELETLRKAVGTVPSLGGNE